MTAGKPSGPGEFSRRAVALFEAGYTVIPIKPPIAVRAPSRSYRASCSLPGVPSDADVYRVEILADGQQWVAYHIHPDTGRPYHWPDGDLPARDDLPEITEASAKHFIERAEAAILMFGGRIKRESRTTSSGTPSSHGQQGTEEAVQSALIHIPNQDVDYYDWVEMLYAIKGLWVKRCARSR